MLFLYQNILSTVGLWSSGLSESLSRFSLLGIYRFSFHVIILGSDHCKWILRLLVHKLSLHAPAMLKHLSIVSEGGLQGEEGRGDMTHG